MIWKYAGRCSRPVIKVIIYNLLWVKFQMCIATTENRGDVQEGPETVTNPFIHAVSIHCALICVSTVLSMRERAVNQTEEALGS